MQLALTHASCVGKVILSNSKIAEIKMQSQVIMMF